MSTGAALPPSSSNAALQQQALFARVASLERKVWGEDGCAQEAQKKMSLSEAVRKAKASLESLESSCEDLRGIRSLVESLQDEMGLNVTGRLTTRAKEQLLLAGEGDLRRLSSKFKALKSMEPEEIVNPPYLQHMSEHGARLARLESAAFQIAGEVSLVAKKVQQLLAEHGELVGRLNDMFLGLDETLGC